MTTAFSRTSSYRSVEYSGERTVGGPRVYVDGQPLDKRLDVHREAPGGFDWGSEADDKRVCQLAIALLVDVLNAETAVESYHLFAENIVRRELTGESWTITSSDVKDTAHRKHIDRRDYPPNTTPSPDTMPALESVDLTSTTVAEEIALETKYHNILWNTGDRHESLQRLQNIWTGEIDPACDPVRRSILSKLINDLPLTTRHRLVQTFDEMGTLGSWIYYSGSHAWLDDISVSTAQQLRDARPDVVRYFGGEEYIPDHEAIKGTITEILAHDEQGILDQF